MGDYDQDKKKTNKKKTNSLPLVLYVPGLYSSTLEPTSSSSSSSSSKKQSSSSFLGSCFREGQWNPPYSIPYALIRGNRGHPGLRLPITWTLQQEQSTPDGSDDEIYVQDQDNVEAVDCLYFVQDKLLDFLDTLHQNGLIEFHKIVWDWRRSFCEAETKVSTEIESIVGSSNRKAILVTHSTGAMVSWPTLNRHPHWFRAWMNTAGCLLEGTTLFHPDFDHGWDMMSFVHMLSKEDFFSFPGLYTYFPTIDEIVFGPPNNDGKNKVSYYATPDGSYIYPKDLQDKEYRFDVHDIATWEKYKLGIFAWKKKEVSELERQHLKHCLATAKRFRQTHLIGKGGGGDPRDPTFLRHDPQDYNHIKIVCYGTDAVPTHLAHELNAKGKTMNVSITKSAQTTTGDGTVTSTNWITVPGGLQREIIMAEDGSDHAGLVNDAKLQTLLLDLFFDGDDDSDSLKKQSAISLLKKTK